MEASDGVTRRTRKKKRKKTGPEDEKKEVVDYAKDYALCIGEIGLSKEEFYSLTPAETRIKSKAYRKLQDLDSEKYRVLATILYNSWTDSPRTPHQLWPLSIDEETMQDIEEIYARNKRMIDYFNNKKK